MFVGCLNFRPLGRSSVAILLKSIGYLKVMNFPHTKFVCLCFSYNTFFKIIF